MNAASVSTEIETDQPADGFARLTQAVVVAAMTAGLAGVLFALGQLRAEDPIENAVVAAGAFLLTLPAALGCLLRSPRRRWAPRVLWAAGGASGLFWVGCVGLMLLGELDYDHASAEEILPCCGLIAAGAAACVGAFGLYRAFAQLKSENSRLRNR